MFHLETYRQFAARAVRVIRRAGEARSRGTGSCDPAATAGGGPVGASTAYRAPARVKPFSPLEQPIFFTPAKRASSRATSRPVRNTCRPRRRPPNPQDYRQKRIRKWTHPHTFGELQLLARDGVHFVSRKPSPVMRNILQPQDHRWKMQARRDRWLNAPLGTK